MSNLELSYTKAEIRQNIFRMRIEKKSLLIWGVVAFIFFSALIPTSWVPIVALPPFYSNVIVFILVLCGMLSFFRNFLFSRLSLVRYWSALASLLLFITFLGVITNDALKSIPSFISLIWPILILISVPSLCFSIAENLKHDFVRILSRLAVAITFIVVIYGIASVLAPRLGFRGGILTGWNEARLTGPLGNSAILYVVFLPTVGYWTSKMQKGNKYARYGILINVLGLIMTFARAAFLSLGLWAFWLIFANKKISVSQKLTIIVILVYNYCCLCVFVC